MVGPSGCRRSSVCGCVRRAGVVAAGAVQVVGQQTTGAERTVDTDTVTVRLTQGNPDDDGQAPSGKIQGVTIHLARLAGLDPNNADDVARVQDAGLAEVREWRTDVHVDGHRCQWRSDL